MQSFTADWPNDADGGVFRRLASDNFDFSASHTVDYNVDFETWPPPSAAVDWLQANYGALGLYPPDDGGLGYVQFQVLGQATYEGVTVTQRRVGAAMEPYGGVCESWGVMH